MSTKVLLLLFVAATMAQLSLDAQWKDFKSANNKSYDETEDAKRFAIFQQNVKNIEEHNKRYDEGKETYKMGINKFADLTPEEFKNRFLGLKRPSGAATAV